MNFLIAFLIAAAVGLTGIGAGSFTVPALVVLAGLPAGEAVGTAFVFAGALRLVAAPFYLLGKHFHGRYLWLLLQGAVPGLLVGTFALRLLRDEAGNPGVVIVLGVVLAASASITFAPRAQNPGFVLLGCALARVVPARRLKAVVAAIAIFAGMQLIWNGANTLLGNRAAGSARIAARAPSRTGSR